MPYSWTCNTKDCPNNAEIIYFIDPTNPILCGLCGESTDAVEIENIPQAAKK